MKYHDEFLSPEPPDPQLQAGPQIPGDLQEEPPTHTFPVLPTYTALGLLLAGGEQSLFILPRGLEAQSALAGYSGASPKSPQFPDRCADSPPLAGPGCARAAWPPAGAPKPSSFSIPAISLSCWARKAAAGSSSAASGAPLSDDEKKPKSSAIFPASLLERPPGARLCPARAPHCARRPRHCYGSAQGADLGGDWLGAAGPHFLFATGPGSPVTAVRAGGAGTGMW